jgi:hypothetical protein
MVLAAADKPMRGADIHRAVERMLGHPVSKNSVSWCLAAGVQGTQPRFERISYGVYRLSADICCGSWVGVSTFR